MSAMISRTFNYIASSLPLVNSGPRWSVPDRNAGPCAHLPAGLATFLNSLYQAETRAEERELVAAHMRSVEEKLREAAEAKTSVVADAMVRAMAAHTLGYDVRFAHIYALQLAQKGSILEKKMGYLACALFLSESDDLILLLVNTIMRDLGSKNIMEVNIALTAAVELTPGEMAPMILPALLEKTTHTKDFIRKKALVCLHSLLRRNSSLAPQIEARVFQKLTDQDPGVVAVTVQVLKSLYELKEKCQDACKIVPGLLNIQDQILDHKLPSEYDRQGAHGTIPAPWFQIDILSLVATLVERSEWDAKMYDQITKSLYRTMEQPNATKECVGQAVIYQCIVVISTMNRRESDVDRTAKAVHYVCKFLQSKNHNCKYMALSGFEVLLRNSRAPQLTEAQEETVLDCLAHHDDTVRRKALALLWSLANETNAKTVCKKLTEQSRVTKDPVQKEDLVAKTMELADRFGADPTKTDWYVSSLLKLLQTAAGAQRDVIMGKMKARLSQGAAEDSASVGKKLLRVLTRLLATTPNATAARLYVWAVAEFPRHLEDGTEALAEICRVGALEDDFSSERWQPVLGSCLDALFSLLVSSDYCDNQDVIDKSNARAFLSKCAHHSSSFAADQATELLCIIQNLSEVKKTMSSAVVDVNDFTLSYLDEVVVGELSRSGAQPYDPSLRVRDRMQVMSKSDSNSSGLRFSSYQQSDDILLKQSDIATGSFHANAEEWVKPKAIWSKDGRKKQDQPLPEAKSSQRNILRRTVEAPEDKSELDDFDFSTDNWRE